MLPQPEGTSALWLLVCWLAAWRVTALLIYEAGPLEVFTRLRRGLARVSLGRLIQCFHCMAFWVSAMIVLVAFEWSARTILLVLAVAGAVSLAERAVGGEAVSTDRE